MQNIFELEKSTDIQQNDSYLISYPYILSYFDSLDEIAMPDVVRGAHMVYGWMPTVLDLYTQLPDRNLKHIAKLLTKAKNNGHLNDHEILDIAAVINNSLVGASKLLHFISPDNFAIWDSKIYRFVYREKSYHQRVNKIDKFKEYLSRLSVIRTDRNFQNFHKSVNDKIGYKVSAMRAIELVMFLNAPER